jgi:hypothetical protein
MEALKNKQAQSFFVSSRQWFLGNPAYNGYMMFFLWMRGDEKIQERPKSEAIHKVDSISQPGPEAEI